MSGGGFVSRQEVNNSTLNDENTVVVGAGERPRVYASKSLRNEINTVSELRKQNR